MSTDDIWPEDIGGKRREVVRQTIRLVNRDELKQFGDSVFKVVTDPWCEKFNTMLRENPNSRFYKAQLPEGADIIYCADAEMGMWFLEDSGMGFLQPKGVAMLREIVSSL